MTHMGAKPENLQREEGDESRGHTRHHLPNRAKGFRVYRVYRVKGFRGLGVWVLGFKG